MFTLKLDMFVTTTCTLCLPYISTDRLDYQYRCGIFDSCLLSFPQNERKIYKLRQLSLSQFVYF